MIAVIGPYICGNCYEVGYELYDEFSKSFSEDELTKIFRKKPDSTDKLLLDNGVAVRFTLEKSGIAPDRVYGSLGCTYEDKRLRSWRRDHDKSRQMLTGIYLV